MYTSTELAILYLLAGAVAVGSAAFITVAIMKSQSLDSVGLRTMNVGLFVIFLVLAIYVLHQQSIVKKCFMEERSVEINSKICSTYTQFL